MTIKRGFQYRASQHFWPDYYMLYIVVYKEIFSEYQKLT